MLSAVPEMLLAVKRVIDCSLKKGEALSPRKTHTGPKPPPSRRNARIPGIRLDGPKSDPPDGFRRVMGRAPNADPGAAG